MKDLLLCAPFEALSACIKEIKKNTVNTTNLHYLFHRDFDSQEDIPRGFALEYTKREGNIPDRTKNILYFPNPSALQPKNMIGLVYDFLIHAHWKPKHIANVLRDIYQNSSFNWTRDFFKYPAEEKANFWARTYSALSLWKTSRLNLWSEARSFSSYAWNPLLFGE